jgi:hypothetical protein
MKKLLISTAIGLVLVTAFVSTTFAASAAGRELPLKGSIQSLETYIVNFPTMSVTASGSGHATHLGKFTVSYTVQVNLLTNEGTGGAVQFIAANGDILYAEGGGQATATSNPSVFNVVENYNITDGTGRFADASGSITLHRVVDITTGAASGTMVGNIHIP